jgi:16S rRNA (guanine966-N2)-methyltransferase
LCAVTRIVAGSAGGRPLRVPARGTRPTSERVREALFSRLAHLGAVDGARVLDLYAGSGALGLEAASRGAARVVLVEASRDAAATCRRNAADLGLGDRVAVVTGTVEGALARLAGRAGPGPFDLVLLDPPYDLAEDALAAVLAGLVPPVLATGAVVVVERARRSPEPRWPATLAPGGARTYGDTALWFATVGA